MTLFLIKKELANIDHCKDFMFDRISWELTEHVLTVEAKQMDGKFRRKEIVNKFIHELAH